MQSKKDKLDIENSRSKRFDPVSWLPKKLWHYTCIYHKPYVDIPSFINSLDLLFYLLIIIFHVANFVVLFWVSHGLKVTIRINNLLSFLNIFVVIVLTCLYFTLHVFYFFKLTIDMSINFTNFNFYFMYKWNRIFNIF